MATLISEGLIMSTFGDFDTFHGLKDIAEAMQPLIQSSSYLQVDRRGSLSLSSGSSAADNDSVLTDGSRKDDKESIKNFDDRFIRHTYIDRLFEPVQDGNSQNPNDRTRASTSFPGLIYFILQHASKDGKEHIFSWQPHGRCFIVRNQKAFVKEIMPKYFETSKFASFQRQLNLYGFSRLSLGNDRGAYYHEYFLRGRPDLLVNLKRQRVKGSGVRRIPLSETEPNFYTLPYAGETIGSSQDRPATQSVTAPLSADTVSVSKALMGTDSSSLFITGPGLHPMKANQIAADTRCRPARVYQLQGNNFSQNPDTSMYIPEPTPFMFGSTVSLNAERTADGDFLVQPDKNGLLETFF